MKSSFWRRTEKVKNIPFTSTSRNDKWCVQEISLYEYILLLMLQEIRAIFAPLLLLLLLLFLYLDILSAGRHLHVEGRLKSPSPPLFSCWLRTQNQTSSSWSGTYSRLTVHLQESICNPWEESLSFLRASWSFFFVFLWMERVQVRRRLISNRIQRMTGVPLIFARSAWNSCWHFSVSHMKMMLGVFPRFQVTQTPKISSEWQQKYLLRLELLKWNHRLNSTTMSDVCLDLSALNFGSIRR